MLNEILGRMTLCIWRWQYAYPGRCRVAGWTIIAAWAAVVVLLAWRITLHLL